MRFSFLHEYSQNKIFTIRWWYGLILYACMHAYVILKAIKNVTIEILNARIQTIYTYYIATHCAE